MDLEKEIERINKNICDGIRAVRKELGMTVDDFSKNLGLSIGVIQRAETHKMVPKDLTLKRISALYNVSMDFLYHGTPPMFIFSEFTWETSIPATRSLLGPEACEDLGEYQVELLAQLLYLLRKNTHLQYTLIDFFVRFIDDNRDLLPDLDEAVPGD